MIKRVLILGGYGNFGSFIALRLAKDSHTQLIIAGRSEVKANSFAQELEAQNNPETAQLDINVNFSRSLQDINPDIVIHTSGPFQAQGYQVAKACIDFGCHYIDLADGRSFVEGITELNQAAHDKGVLVISGASSVPCFTAALVDHYLPEFGSLHTLDYGITTAQKSNRGLATTKSILGYVGGPFETLLDNSSTIVYGWQDLHTRKYAFLGNRMLGNCDVPDLALFTKRYPGLRSIRFYAGLEIRLLHLILWALSGMVRIGLVKQLHRLAPLLLRISFLFDWAGTDNSGFHMELSGTDKCGKSKRVTFELVAKHGHGPYIPCTPAILLTRKLTRETIDISGAFACIGFITKDEYLDSLSDLDISWIEF